MAAGAGRKQSEPDWDPSLHWTVVPARAGADQQPDTRNTTTGRNDGMGEGKKMKILTEVKVKTVELLQCNQLFKS